MGVPEGSQPGAPFPQNRAGVFDGETHFRAHLDATASYVRGGNDNFVYPAPKLFTFFDDSEATTEDAANNTQSGSVATRTPPFQFKEPHFLRKGLFHWNKLPFEMRDAIIGSYLDSAASESYDKIKRDWRIEHLNSGCRCPPLRLELGLECAKPYFGRRVGTRLITRAESSNAVVTEWGMLWEDMPLNVLFPPLWCTGHSHNNSRLHGASGKQNLDRTYSIIPAAREILAITSD